MKNTKVSIVIPTYNRAEELVQCLRSIFQQDYKNYEVIIVDDNSTDKTREKLMQSGWLKKNNRIKYFRNNRNLGVSIAKNRAITKARGKYLWFLDSDTAIKDNHCLSSLIRIAQENKKLGAIGCEIIERGGKWQIREHSFFGNDKTYPLRAKINLKPIDYLATCNCFARTDLVKTIGGFNQKYFYGYEDAELGKRIRDFGYQNLLDSRIPVYHFRATGTRTANYKIFFKNRIRFCLWNFSLIHFMKLPFIDVKNFFSGIRSAKNISQKEIKGQSETILTLFLGKFGVVLEYFGGLIYGYLWNLIYLPKTIIFDRRRINYV